MLIGGLQKVTLTDFPGKVACIVFLVNCNFRCRYCYNKDLLSFQWFGESGRAFVSEKKFFSFLERNKKMLDGVVITGGEPTMSPELVYFLRKIKAYGFLVKLDTNGSRPEVLSRLIDEKLVDYIAMDFKSTREKHFLVTQSGTFYSKILESLSIIKSSKIPHEFRTTLYPALTSGDLIEMSSFLLGENWFFQHFQPQNSLDEKSRWLRPLGTSVIEEVSKSVEGKVNLFVRP